MKYNFKKKLTAMLAATLAAVTFVSIPANALSWNGTAAGGGGSSSSSTNNNYSISDTSNTACGYRFSRVDYYGVTQNGPIDVACSSYHTLANAQTAYRFDSKFNKKQLIDLMYNTDISWSTSSQWINTDTNVIGVALPTDTKKIQDTVTEWSTFDKICNAIGMTGGVADLKNGDKILVEPLFALTLKGDRHVLTVTEIGIWGASEFKGGWSAPGHSANDGGKSFNFISNYTNANWPSSLYSTDETFWSAGWDAWGDGKNVWSRIIKFGQLVTCGFGVGLAYDNKDEPIETVDVDLYPTGVTFKDQWGNDATVLVEGNTYTPVFHYYNYGSVGVYARVSAWSYPLWKDVMYDDSGNMSTRIYIGAWSEYAITAKESFTITPDLYYSDPARKFTDYEYWVNTIKHLLTIGLDCDSSYDADGNYVYVTQTNTGNDQATYTHNFIAKQPSISQWVADEENANSSWITDNSINGNWKLYSGEQVSSYRWISNNSKFNINIIDNFRAFLGLDNSFFATNNGEGYFRANGQEGSTWSRKTGVIRAKNTDVNTHKTLYLLDTAAEKSYNQVTGFNYPDMNNIANNVSLNQQQFYQSTSYPSGNGNIMIKQWDNNSRILTLNGTDTTGFYNNTFDYYLKPWTRYRVTVEYVSGSVSSNGAYACLAFQGYNEDGGRDFVDIQFPYCQAQGTGAVCTGFLNTSGKSQSTFRAWLYIASGGQVVFNNYRVKVKIEEVQGTDWDLQYTKHIQGYSIVPTDLQTQSLVLYDADTGVRINEGTVLKAGQRVYIETTYRNNTEVAVAAELLTVHNNNSNSYYWNTDDGTLKDRVQCDTSSVSNSEFKESLVIAPNQYVTVRSNTFEISAVNDNKMTLWSQIYLKNLADNTEYEYNGYNNTLYKEFEIETPFKPSIVQANSLYRKGINVITSFKVKNDSKRDFGTTTDVNNYGKLTAKLEIYRNSSMTGTPIVAYADYCVPANGGETLVWFEWKVPTDSPSKLYAKMICDAYNRYSAWNFVDNGTNSKNMYSVFNIVQPKVTSTPDTTFAKSEPYWYESGHNSATAPSEGEGLGYYDIINTKDEELKNYNKTLNSQTFFKYGNKNGLRQSWDNTTRVLSLTGSINAYECSLDAVAPILIPADIKAGDVFELKVTYISGTVEEIGDNPAKEYSAVVLDLMNQENLGIANPTERRYIDVGLPKLGNNPTEMSGTVLVKSTDLDLGKGLRLFVYAGNNKLILRDYKIKVEISKLSSSQIARDVDNFEHTELIQSKALGDTAYQSWDNDSRILTLNGTAVNTTFETYNTGKQDRGFFANVSPGDMFRVKLTYISGSIDTSQSLAWFVLDTAGGDRMSSANSTALSRAWKDIALPMNNNPDRNSPSRIGILDTYYKNADTIRQASGLVIRIWVDGTAVFDNYKIKVELEKITDETEKSLNRERIFANRSWWSANQAFSLEDRALWFNGTAKSAYGGMDFPVTFKEGERYRVTVQYDNGTIDSLNRATGATGYLQFAFCDSSGNWVASTDTKFPNVNFYDGTTESGVLKGEFTASANIVKMNAQVWISTEADGQQDELRFNDYKVDIFFEKLGNKNILDADDSYDTLSWSYYVAEGDNLVLKTEVATLKGSSISLVPDGSPSAVVGYDNKWNIKSGYGYKIDTEFKTNPNSTYVQSGYAVFPELLYKVEDNVNQYTNISGIRTGLETVKNKNPLCGGTYATYSTLEKTKSGTLILPNNESSRTATHFIPIWYPTIDYQITCYVADAWTPGGMLAKSIKSSTLHVVGNMYDDYVVSNK